MEYILTIQYSIAFAGTILLLMISKKSLKNSKVHGFHRFFVFESCMILILINIPYWVVNPFSFQQILSWIFLIISIYLVYKSYSSLKRIGGNKERELNSSNYAFENTASLVTEGIYKYIRHPMYSSLLFLAAGAFLKNISIFSLILLITAIVFLVLTAKTEENENINFFGASYNEYMKNTKMFIPFVL